MRRSFLLSVLVFICSLVSAKTYYVSSTQGSNDNDGLTEQTPKHDLQGVLKEGVTILLKRGDVFWGGIAGYKNCTISTYGKGDRPVICGFKVLANPNAWKAEGKGLWSLNLSNTKDFCGNVEKKADAIFNNIGFIYDADQDKLYGRNVMHPDSLQNEMDFFTSTYFSREDVKEHPFGKVLVKSIKNPAEMRNLCFPAAQYGVERMINCTIRGIAVVGFSLFGMVHLSGCTVDDCQIDMIGGAIFVGYSKHCRYGNGIELSYRYCDNTISNCLISRTYDCATTIQSSGEILSNPRNNHFVDNRIYKCRQAFEHFMNPKDGFLVEYEGCEFSNNVCYLMGQNEFDSPYPYDCNILSYENQAKPIRISNNTFFGANHLDGNGIAEGMTGNKVYIYEDQYIYTRHWLKDKRTILSRDEKAMERYRAIASDDSKIVILRRGSLRARIIERKIKRKVGWKPAELHLERIL